MSEQSYDKPFYVVPGGIYTCNDCDEIFQPLEGCNGTHLCASCIDYQEKTRYPLAQKDFSIELKTSSSSHDSADEKLKLIRKRLFDNYWKYT